jgi:type II secretory pathway component PulK
MLIKAASKKQGSVLILSLFVLFFLSIMALSLSYRMRLQIRLVKYYKDRMKSFYIAKGALALVLAKLQEDKDNNEYDYLNEDWLLYFQKEGEIRNLDFLDTEGIVRGNYNVFISDENSKININRVNSQILEALLSNFKGISNKKVAREIIAYKKNKIQFNDFYSIYELLRLEGMDKEVFWGEDTNENGMLDIWEDDAARSLPLDDQDGQLDLGIKDFISVYTQGKININTAPLVVLASMPAMDQALAMALIDARSKEPFTSLEDLRKISGMSDEVFLAVSNWATVKSDYFKIYIQATASDAKISRQILAVVDRSLSPPKIIYWRED